MGLFSCDGDGYSSDPTPIPTTTTFNATLSGVREVPPNNSTATGTAVLTFNNTTKIFSITVTHNVVGANVAHIHKGAVGVSGDIVFPLTSTSATTYTYTSPALTTAQEADLKAELYYVNIHSATYSLPLGEIRGQLFKQGTGGGSY
ncbi:CHRD domain-containing protein [Flavobacterium gawalongense]|uniref:CHRD domain-containing protein n=1 Tax=Flavobacterium gawalongense TaxID=2594432 RepID=UPI00163D6669|nr:CHRD domain-containing protein [Flavobacterium gawalongense]